LVSSQFIYNDTDTYPFSAGYTDLPSCLPTQSSTLYSNNITKFLLSMNDPKAPDSKALAFNLEDKVVQGLIIFKDGKLLFPPPAPAHVPPPLSTMYLAIVLHGPSDLCIKHHKVQPPATGEVQVSIQATGLCRSDHVCNFISSYSCFSSFSFSLQFTTICMDVMGISLSNLLLS